MQRIVPEPSFSQIQSTAKYCHRHLLSCYWWLCPLASVLALSSSLSGSKSQVPFKLCHCWSGPIQKETVGQIKGKSCQDRRGGEEKGDRTLKLNWALEYLIALDHILQVQQFHALKQDCTHSTINYLVIKKQTLSVEFKLVCPRNSSATGFQTPLPWDIQLQVPTWHQYTQQK